MPEQGWGSVGAAVIDKDVKPIVRAEHVIEIVRQRLGVRQQNGLLIENRDYDRQRQFPGGWCRR